MAFEKLARLLSRGHRANHIQKCAAEEHSIGTEIGRWDSELAQLTKHQFVHGIL